MGGAARGSLPVPWADSLPGLPVSCPHWSWGVCPVLGPDASPGSPAQGRAHVGLYTGLWNLMGSLSSSQGISGLAIPQVCFCSICLC